MNQLRQLEAFRAVIIAGGVTPAANMLNISQPAVSRLVANLETAIGIPLFERSGGRLHPTMEADYLYDEVDRAISNLEHVSQLAADIRNQKAGHLRIACLPGFATTLLPGVVSEFLKDRSDITVKLQTRSSDRVREWIAAQQYDIGIADEFEGHRAVHHEFMNIRTECVLSPRHPLAHKKIITPQDLDDVPMITIDRDTRIHQAMETAFEEVGAILKSRVEVRQFSTACIMARNEVGVAIVSSIDAAEYNGKGIIVRPFEPQMPFRLDILYPKYHPRSLILQEFIQHFKTALEPFALN
jgi:DNA-binding transcriptional LysR family regulator